MFQEFQGTHEPFLEKYLKIFQRRNEKLFSVYNKHLQTVLFARGGIASYWPQGESKPLLETYFVILTV